MIPISAARWRQCPVPRWTGYEISSDGRVRDGNTGRHVGPPFLKKSGVLAYKLRSDDGREVRTFSRAELLAYTYLDAPTDRRIWVGHRNDALTDDRLSAVYWREAPYGRD